MENQELDEKDIYPPNGIGNWTAASGEGRHVATTPYCSVKLLGYAAHGTANFGRGDLCRK